MPLLRWLASALRASFWLIVNLAIAGGLLLASAALFANTDDDFRVPGSIVRTIGAIWLYSAVWAWFVRGILRRPPPPTAKKKPTGAEAARGAAGCIANIVVVAVVWVALGRIADWAIAGLTGPDPQHPARQLADRALGLLQLFLARPEVYAPRLVGAVIAVSVLMALLSRLSGPSTTMTLPQAKAALKTAKQQKKKGGAPPAGAAPSQIPTRAGAAIEKAHGGAHPSRASGGTRDDAVLGTLRYAPADSGWWARQQGDQFPIRIDADDDGPSSRQIDLARAVAQRAFEAQLRASDAARAAAQARGIGLPRFSIVAASVGPDAGDATPVTLHLRCDGDPQHEYTVRSTNGLHSYTA